MLNEIINTGKIKIFIVTGIILALVLSGCVFIPGSSGGNGASFGIEAFPENWDSFGTEASYGTETAPGSGTKTLRIIGTSDLHGKFMPWDYATDSESYSGSLCQLSTALSEYRNDETLLLDGGDLIQDNNADIFISEDDVHPMVQGLNAIKYDVFVPGNHEYNYGMEVFYKTVSDLDCKVLTGNLYDESGKSVADGYTIIEKNGLRVAVIGMVTPGIMRWDKENLKGYTATDALEETRSIIDSINGKYDVLIGVYHMGLGRDFNIENSSVSDILRSCPEFDLMISAHSHGEIEGEFINGILTVQNKNMAQTMAVVDLSLENKDGSWKVMDRDFQIVDIKDYKEDPEIVKLLSEYHEYARADAEQVIGELTGGPLAPKNEVKGIPEAQLRDTALIDLINRVQLYYTGADVSAAALFSANANLYPGDIRKKDTSRIYKYANTLYTLRMTGAQLKKYMESSAEYYNTFHPGDLTISFNDKMRVYLYDMFEGVNYEIDISEPEGKRIKNLTWPDGRPVKADDEFILAVNDYRANSSLLTPGIVYSEKEELPVLLEKDVHGEIGGIRELIGDYIKNVKKGTISPECNDNWRLTGVSYDPKMRQKAVNMINSGELSLPASNDGRTVNVRSITAEDLH